MQLYNTKTRKKESFTPHENNHVKMYSCGPTVYSSAHIGNMRSFVMADLIKRALRMNGYAVTHVMNITDVGHLISTTEQDKMEEAAKRNNATAQEIAKKYTDEFLQDLGKLNIIPADYYPKATEYIQAQIALIQTLEKKGFTYTISDGVYFDTAKFPSYGSLSGQSLADKQEGARVEKNTEKRNATDFALWKFSPKNEQRQMEWESPWGIGFPGWHIECSAMSMDLLGQPIDIHTGAIDLIPVHHENEIAQSESASDQEFVRFWMHGEFVDINNEKMAKSDGNIFTITDLETRNYHPLSYRYLLLTTHYRSKLNFTLDALSASQTALFNIRNTVRNWDQPTEPDHAFITRCKATLADDVNTPQLLALTWELIKSDRPTGQKSATLLLIDEGLGLNLKLWVATPLSIPEEIKTLMHQRLSAREQKQWDLADEIRQKIEANGFLIEDTPEGQKISEK